MAAVDDDRKTAARNSLIGEWTLVSWRGLDDRGNRVDLGGETPSGELIYLASGRVAVQIQFDGRTRFGSRDWSAGTAAERADAYSTYNAYCGTYEVPTPGVVVHHVELAIHPDQTGMDKRRSYELDGDELVLRPQEVDPQAGTTNVEIRWRRRSA